jgi:coniferyl-aldehyde dehydrogenase
MNVQTTDGHADMLQTLHRMQSAQQSGGAVSTEVRIDRLRRLMAMLEQHAEAFCSTLEQDFSGRSRETTLMNDILATFGTVKYARRQVRRWMRPDRRAGVLPFNLLGARVEVRHEPKGVVGILGTWNVPLFTTLAPLASVLAAGNRAMLKPSEMTPNTSALLAKAVSASFDRDELSVFTGGVEVSSAFSRLPLDHLVLTGSARTGRAVMQAAAEHLVPVTLELGGKSPVLVGRSADLVQAAHRIVLGKTMNAGQICVTPDTVYVPAESLEAFLQACVAQYQAMFPQGANDGGWTSVINAQHGQRIRACLEELKARGARMVPCGLVGAEPDGQRLSLVLAVDPPVDSRLAREEIFGPVLQVQTYQTLAEAVERIHAGDSPLALYYFGQDKTEERYVLDHTRSGGVAVNDVMLHVAAHDAPFGGVGASGMGCYHGYEGFLQFSHPRTVYRSGRWDPRRALGLVPPYGPKVYERLRKTLRV